ncbi:MAG: methyltransferase domain-containing protein [Actinomycetota bacterium]|nr:methyltransferase domain-containing protein [Actinomycetota bacterium]
MPADSEVFDSHLEAWDEYLTTPWARIRYDVVAHVLDETIAGLCPGPLRVLDLGGGDGVDSIRLAAAGHEVTIVDQAAGMLERARANSARRGCTDRVRTIESDILSWRPDRTYDLVLCHFVLPYLDKGEGQRRMWRLLHPAVEPDGAASVTSTNPVSEVLSAVHRDGDAELALRRFDGQAAYAGMFHHEIHSPRREDVEQTAVAGGFEVTRRIGLRVAVDLLPDGPAKHDPGAYPAILRLEFALAEEKPYLDIARAWQLLLHRLPAQTRSG